jgi:hypothetical protein
MDARSLLKRRVRRTDREARRSGCDVLRSFRESRNPGPVAVKVKMGNRLVLRAREAPWEFRVPAGGSGVLGRRTDRADLCVPHLSVSSRHARVFERDGLWYIQDLGSRCGVCVNRSPARETQPIGPGDVIRLGSVELDVEVEDDAQ